MGRTEVCARCRAIDQGQTDAKVVVAVTVNWGDERGEWEGKKAFCSFAHLAEWAAEKAEEHD